MKHYCFRTTQRQVSRLIYHRFGRLPGCPVTYRPSLLNYGDEFVQDLHLFPFSPEPASHYLSKIRFKCLSAPTPLCYIFSFFVRCLRNRFDYYITTCNIIQQIFIRRFTDTFTKAVQKAAKYSAAACLQMRYHLCFPHTPPLKPQTSLSHPLLFFRCTESCTCIQNPQNSSTCS